MGRTTVTITSETHKRLNEYKGDGVSHDRAINDLLDDRGKIADSEVHEAVEALYEHEKSKEGTDYGHGLEDGARTVAMNLGVIPSTPAEFRREEELVEE